jgi:hypothetical protein
MVVGHLVRVLFITLLPVLPPPVPVLLQTVPEAVVLQPAPAPVLHVLEAVKIAAPVLLMARYPRAAVLLEQEQQLLAQAR